MYDYEVILIYLPKPFLKEPEAQAPLGLMYIASSLEHNGNSVDLRNYSSHSEDEAIKDLPRAILYGITVTSMEIPYANSFAKKIKEKYPESKIVLGGPGIYGTEVIDWVDTDYVDTICIGEGEVTTIEILEDAKMGFVHACYFGKLIEELDVLPLPARHLLKNKQGGHIFAYGHNYLGEESTVIISSRGCPYKCSFCAAPKLSEHSSVRFRSTESVISEMRHVIDTYGIRQFRFSDDMFTANKRRMIELCEEIEKLDVVWRISCRVKPLDKEMLKALWFSGCKELSFGVESFDNDVLAGLNKKATCADNVKALEMSYEMGFKTRILFMIRTPFQTPKTIQENMYWIQRVPYSIISCTSFIPLPGTDVWFNPDKYNIEILDRDLINYNFYMFNSEGRIALKPIFKIKDRDLDEFLKESEEFREWVDNLGTVNRG